MFFSGDKVDFYAFQALRQFLFFHSIAKELI